MLLRPQVCRDLLVATQRSDTTWQKRFLKTARRRDWCFESGSGKSGRIPIQQFDPGGQFAGVGGLQKKLRAVRENEAENIFPFSVVRRGGGESVVELDLVRGNGTVSLIGEKEEDEFLQATEEYLPGTFAERG